MGRLVSRSAERMLKRAAPRRGNPDRDDAGRRAAVSPLLLLALGAAVLLWLYSRTQKGSIMVGKAVSSTTDAVRSILEPRGIRNNNPGNIERTADRWSGMSADQSADPRFVVFDAPVWGLRALARILRKDMAQGDTLRRIINEWAPPGENDTGAYVNAVASAVGIDADALVTDAELPAVMAAIVQHENGRQPYAPELFAQAIQLERQG